MNININSIALISISLAHLILGLIILRHDRRNRINISYALFVWFLAVWVFSTVIFLQSKEFFTILAASRTVYASAFLFFTALIYFCIFFPEEKPKFSQKGKILLALPGIAFSLLTLSTRFLVAQIFILPTGWEIVFGPLFYVFILYSLFAISYGLLNLLEKYEVSHGLPRIQIRYIFFSFIVIGISGIAFNGILPAIGDYRFMGIAPYFILFGAILIAYPLTTRRLISIEFFIQKGFIYTLITASIIAIFAIAGLLSERVFRPLISYSYVILAGLAALVVALAYQPMFKLLQGISDKLFFRERYDYQRTLREVSQAITSVIKLEELSRLIISAFIEAIKVSEISFLLLDKIRHRYRSVAVELKAETSRYKRIEIDERSPIVSWLRERKDILVEDELESEIRSISKGVEKEKLETLRGAMERLEVAVWVPIVSKDELIGIIALGEKLSREIFTSEDLGLLTTLANQTAVALDNVRLYEEVVNMKNYSEEILESMVNGVLTTDMDGKIITFNDMAEKITGWATSEVLGKNCKEIWGEKGLLSEAVFDTAKGRRYTSFEGSILSKAKSLVPVNVSTIELKDSRGKKIGILVSIADRTEMKKLESRARQADKLTALGTMAAGMAHEIKNPLSSMKVLSQLLPSKFTDPEFRKKFTEIMPREIGRIDRIVESLLGFARATTPKFEPVSVEAVIEETLEYLDEKIKGSGIKVVKEYTPLPKISADIQQLSQVFMNLLLNAIQAMPDGGELKIFLTAGRKTGNVVEEISVKISDTGHGISEEYLEKLFDPFFTTKHGGTGLGLTIAHSIIGGHKGTIAVKSKIGKGTTFYITLPVTQ